MIFDAALILAGSISAGGVITGQAANGAGSILGSNTIDLAPLMLGGVPGQVGDLGNGESLYVAISVLGQPSVGTVQFQLIQADDAAMTTNVQVINQTDAYASTALTVGTIIPLGFDPAAPYLPKRYISLRIVNSGAAAGAGYFAGIVKDVQSPKTVFRGGYGIT